MNNSEFAIFISVAAIIVSGTPLILALANCYLNERERRAERQRWAEEDRMKR